MCALSPAVLLLVSITMALHIRLGFGHWPDQAVLSFPAFHFRVHDWLFIAAMLSAVFALIHLLVTLVHHRQLGVGLRQVAAQALVYVAGWVAFFVVASIIPARFVSWFLD
jgi:hypothetical protein